MVSAKLVVLLLAESNRFGSLFLTRAAACFAPDIQRTIRPYVPILKGRTDGHQSRLTRLFNRIASPIRLRDDDENESDEAKRLEHCTNESPYVTPHVSDCACRHLFQHT